MPEGRDVSVQFSSTKLRRKGSFGHDQPLTTGNLNLLERIDSHSFALITAKLSGPSSIGWSLTLFHSSMPAWSYSWPVWTAGNCTAGNEHADKRDHIQRRMSFGIEDEAKNEYATNIQIAELNALNASLAVLRWKRLLGFYWDAGREHYTSHQFATGELCNEDQV